MFIIFGRSSGFVLIMGSLGNLVWLSMAYFFDFLGGNFCFVREWVPYGVVGWEGVLWTGYFQHLVTAVEKYSFTKASI